MKTPGIKSDEVLRNEISDIIKNGVTYSGQVDAVVIHGAIEALVKSHKAYASQFVKEAAENAKTKIDYVAGQNFIGVDKDSILSLLKLIEND